MICSPVIWNPWVEQSKDLSDFGDEEFPNMGVCGSRPRVQSRGAAARHSLRGEPDTTGNVSGGEQCSGWGRGIGDSRWPRGGPYHSPSRHTPAAVLHTLAVHGRGTTTSITDGQVPRLSPPPLQSTGRV
ncbi:uncharacterized protein LOC124355196 [Homalodisca vitripennis]|uniref:uncharacterized protein LOC124355196 n=1 Tax=Homalodisca vitripennis TaxID=197043 RepID=UPI001EEC6864|nr:uncharacterized protein LOC124355196 [Homalodisca vitripennis]